MVSYPGDSDSVSLGWHSASDKTDSAVALPMGSCTFLSSRWLAHLLFSCHFVSVGPCAVIVRTMHYQSGHRVTVCKRCVPRLSRRRRAWAMSH
jgi:hypothetical protein